MRPLQKFRPLSEAKGDASKRSDDRRGMRGWTWGRMDPNNHQGFAMIPSPTESNLRRNYSSAQLRTITGPGKSNSRLR